MMIPISIINQSINLYTFQYCIYDAFQYLFQAVLSGSLFSPVVRWHTIATRSAHIGPPPLTLLIMVKSNLTKMSLCYTH